MDGDGHPPQPTGPGGDGVHKWRGILRGITWNSNGLVQSAPQNKFDKCEQLLAMMQGKDFAVIPETHSTATSAEPYTLWFETRGYICFWSHHESPRARAGVGIIVAKSFMDNFSVAERAERKPGRILTVKLTTANRASLHITGTYFSSDSPCARKEEIATTMAAVSNREHHIIAGDFNFTAHAGDRFSFGATQRWDREADKESAHWADCIPRGVTLTEFYQPRTTYYHRDRTSRIDRAYTNLNRGEMEILRPRSHVAEYVAKSDHKPLCFSLQEMRHPTEGPPMLPTWVFQGARYKQLAQELYGATSLQRATETASDRLGRLLWACASAGERVLEEHNEGGPTCPHGKLNVMRGALIAFRNRDLWRLQKLSKLLPELTPFASDLWTEDRERALFCMTEAVCQECLQADIRKAEKWAQEAQGGSWKATKAARRQARRIKQKTLPPTDIFQHMYDNDKQGVVSGPSEVVRTINSHWEGVFGRSFTPDEAKLREWKAGFTKRFTELNLEAWLPTREDVAEAIKAAKHSAPGPDRLPFEALKPVVDLAAEVIHGIIQEMFLNPSWSPPPYFNQAWLCMLPKKPKLVDHRGDIYSPENLRPLSIVSTFNRIIANAMRRKLAARLEEIIGPTQKGFMKGRSILDNVIEVDIANMRVTLTEGQGGLVLFDFNAAFPSVSHDYMWEILGHTGAPTEFIRACRHLYVKNHHKLRAHGVVYESVDVKSGVRQGCPISPLLFLIAIEPLLTKLREEVPTTHFGAYADDIGAVVPSISKDLPRIITIFEDFARISGLTINVGKTILIPARREFTEATKAEYEEALSRTAWPQLPVVGSGKYLGFHVGPDVKAAEVYQRIIGKIRDRLLHWRGSTLNLFDKIRIWNTFLGSLLSYTDQLLDLPAEERNTLLQLMQKFLGGPHGWLPARAACGLREECNFPIAPRDPGPNNLAAQCRVRMNLPDHIKNLIAGIRGYNPGYSQHNFPSSPALCIREVDNKLRALRLTRTNIKTRATHHDAHGVATVKKVQHHAYDMCRSRWHLTSEREATCARTAGIHDRVRTHAVHNYRGHPRDGNAHAASFIKNMREICKHVPPRVSTCMLRCGLHGWHTEHRFGRSSPCFLCNEGDDSVLHISNCRVVRAVHNAMMPGVPFDKWLWLGHVRMFLTEEQRVTLAYCTFGAHECRRYHAHHGRHTHVHAQQVARSVMHQVSAACACGRGSLASAIRSRVTSALASLIQQ